MPFRITGLAPEPLRALFRLSDKELTAKGINRYVANSKPGFPDRIELRDAEPGEAREQSLPRQSCDICSRARAAAL